MLHMADFGLASHEKNVSDLRMTVTWCFMQEESVCSNYCCTERSYMNAIQPCYVTFTVAMYCPHCIHDTIDAQKDAALFEYHLPFALSPRRLHIVRIHIDHFFSRSAMLDIKRQH